jgi:hypothetical protein
MPSIQLNFINQSSDQNNSQVVIFQENEAAAADTAIAWRVIDSRAGDSHAFTFSDTLVAAADSYGNYSPQLPASAGQQFTVATARGGHQFAPTGASGRGEAIEFVNALPQGAVSAWIYRDGRKLAAVTGIVPGQKASFVFSPAIRIGVVSQVAEGLVMDPAIVFQVEAELSLLGVASADIVMTGGGPGRQSTPYAFTLQNVVRSEP